MNHFEELTTNDVSPERRAAIEGELKDLEQFYIEKFGAEETGSLMTGIMIGARLHAASLEACSVVVSHIERIAAVPLDVPAEFMEGKVRAIVRDLAEAGVANA